MQNLLGKLRHVDVRDAWKNEATGFTPWLALAPNLQLLGETIGLQLELEAVERNVGPFRADILCKEVGCGTIAENGVTILAGETWQVEITGVDFSGRPIVQCANWYGKG